MKITLSILALLLLASCRGEQYTTGYIVSKEYTPEHECCSNPIVVKEAAFVHVRTHRHRHELKKESYVIHIANKRTIRHYHVSKDFYQSKRLGQKIRMKNY